MKNKIIKKFLSFSIGGYIVIIFSFLTTPIITRMISPENYGTFSLFNLISNMIYLVISLGLDRGFIRYYNEEKSKNSLLFTCIAPGLSLITIISSILIFFEKVLNIKILPLDEIFVLIVMVIILLFNKFSLVIIRMNEKAKTYSGIQILTHILNFIFIILFYRKYKDNYKVLIYSIVISTLISTIIAIFLEKKNWKFRRRLNKKKRIEILQYSYPLLCTGIISWAFQSIDRLMVKEISGLYSLGLYSGAYKIAGLLNIFKNSFMIFWSSVAYKKYAENNEDYEFYEKIFEALSFLMFIIILTLLIGKNYLILILGESFRLGKNILPGLLIGPVLYILSEVTGIGINLKKQTNRHVRISIIVLIVNGVLNYILIKKIGAKGAALSTGASFILFFYLRTYYSLRLINFKFKLKRLSICVFSIYIFIVYSTFYDIYNAMFGFILLILTLYLYRDLLQKLIVKRWKK